MTGLEEFYVSAHLVVSNPRGLSANSSLSCQVLALCGTCRSPGFDLRCERGGGSETSSVISMNRSGVKRLATEISSSISSQWIPIPPPMNSHRFFCLSVAPRRRGNHCKGTVIVRPSSSSTVRASREQDTSIAIASLLATKVCIPALQEKLSILINQDTNICQFMDSKTTVCR